MPITAYDVASAYLLLLGREASTQELNTWFHVQSPSELREIFLSSQECRNYLRTKVPNRGSDRLSLDVPGISIEWDVSNDLQIRLLDYVTATWTALGTTEPHWSVLSADVFKAANMNNAARTFYDSGTVDAKRIEAILSRHSLSPVDFPRAVEYGCGVGRVTPYLAGTFDRVIGVDISESHLALAYDQLKSGHPNVQLVLARVPEFGMTEPFDLWFSYIVLQHNPPPVIAMVLRRMFSTLAPGGVAIFQVPTYVPGYRFNTAEYLAAPKTGKIEVHCLPQQVVFQLAHEAGCTPLEVREDNAMGYPWLSNTFVFRKKSS